MSSLVFAIVILIDCTVAWMLSGSPLPMGLSVLLFPLAWIARRIVQKNSRLTAFCLAILLGAVQMYLFYEGYANVFLADLPLSFHWAVTLHWWCLLQWFIGKGQRLQSGSACFWVALVGAAILIWSAASVEVYDHSPWVVRSLAATPLILLLWSEIFSIRISWWKGALACVALSAAGGLATSYSQTASYQLYRWANQDSEDDWLTDYQPRRSARSNPGADQSTRTLSPEADISFTHQVRFYMQAEDAATFLEWTRRPVYLRSSILGKFEGDSQIAPLRKGEWIYDSDDGKADALTTISPTQPSRPFPYAVLIHRSDVSQLPLLPSTHTIAADSVYEFAQGWFQIAPAEGIEWIRVQASADWEDNYLWESPWLASEGGAFDPAYLEIPNTDLSRRIQQLSAKIVRDTPPEARPSAIRSYLARNCQYSLKYRNPNRLTPVENLLFGEKKGHCELFAAATVLMLRSVGVPARLAYGYAGGQADTRSRLIAFRDSDFHAWAEVLNADEKSWSVFDTTPNVPLAAARRPQLAAVSQVDLDRYRDIAKAEELYQIEGSYVDSLLIDILDWMSAHFLILLAGIALGSTLIYQLRKRLARGKNLTGRGARPLLEASERAKQESFFTDFSTAIADVGKSYGYEKGPGETLMEFVKRLKAKGVTHPAIGEAVSYLYSVQYAAATRNHLEEKNHLKKIRRGG